jgi:hypothetical protein
VTPIEVKLTAVCASCRTHRQVKVARKYTQLACHRFPELDARHWIRMLNRIDANLVASRQPRLNLSQVPARLPTIAIEDDSHADE